MGSVPAFLLKKLYVKGSLKNTATGFEFTIQNTLAPGTIVDLGSLQVDGVTYQPEQVRVILSDGRNVPATEVSAQSPMRFAVGDKVTVQVAGTPLSTGAHKLMLSPKTKEAGVLEISAEDTIA
ncbi:MAG: C-glycoside deglycosidase beta subunit domain-containing protein [Anaerolineae bacterium]